jgi:hypothetical protein
MRRFGRMWRGIVGGQGSAFEGEGGFYPLMPIENIGSLICSDFSFFPRVDP